MSAQAIIPTGIANLDLLLGGGVPRRQSIIVTGNPGTGKTILCSQIAFQQAARGARVVLATVTSEPHDKLLNELSGFSFFDQRRVGDEIFIISAYPALQKGPREAKELLLRAVRDRKASILFIDGLRSIRDLWSNEAALRDFMYELNVALAQMDAIGLFTTEYPLERLIQYPEATTVDGIVCLSTVAVGERVVRRIQVAKLRGRPHVTGQHVFHLSHEGIDIVPRLESIVQPDVTFQPSGTRAEFGLPELDHVLGGGLPAQTTSLLVGSTGVGKTLMALHFAAEGARLGEDVLFVTYSEPAGRLLGRARRIGLDVRALIDSGRLTINYRSPANVEADDLARDITLHVRSHGTKRVVIDGVGELEHGVLDRTRVRDFLEALIVFLRDAGVTAIFIREIAKIAGPELDLSDTPISVTAENMIFLRHVEVRGHLHRVLSVLKMRESGYDSNVREFEIRADGLRVLAPFRSAEGVLTGIGRPVLGANGEG
jgi:circadian clock protein KaiC